MCSSKGCSCCCCLVNVSKWNLADEQVVTEQLCSAKSNRKKSIIYNHDILNVIIINPNTFNKVLCAVPMVAW